MTPQMAQRIVTCFQPLSLNWTIILPLCIQNPKQKRQNGLAANNPTIRLGLNSLNRAEHGRNKNDRKQVSAAHSRLST